MMKKTVYSLALAGLFAMPTPSIHADATPTIHVHTVIPVCKHNKATALKITWNLIKGGVGVGLALPMIGSFVTNPCGAVCCLPITGPITLLGVYCGYSSYKGFEKMTRPCSKCLKQQTIALQATLDSTHDEDEA